jgi:hypothetical protein
MPIQKAETTDFDPSKKDHRAAVAAFLVRKAWVDSPIRFRYDGEYNKESLADQVQSKMLAYYMAKEKLSPVREPLEA